MFSRVAQLCPATVGKNGKARPPKTSKDTKRQLGYPSFRDMRGGLPTKDHIKHMQSDINKSTAEHGNQPPRKKSPPPPPRQHCCGHLRQGTHARAANHLIHPSPMPVPGVGAAGFVQLVLLLLDFHDVNLNRKILVTN